MSVNSKSSRKRSRGGEKKGEEEVSNIKESEETLFWKNNYYEMKKLKEEAEGDLQAEKQLRSSNEDILKEGISILQQKQSSGKEGVSPSPEKESSENSEQPPEKLLQIIKFYESMTAMTVKIKEENKYCCTIKNPSTRQAVRFFISNSTTEGELLYEPSANASLLPEYMNDEALSFVPEMGPVLLGDAIASLFVEEEESDSEEQEEEDEGDESSGDDE